MRQIAGTRWMLGNHLVIGRPDGARVALSRGRPMAFSKSAPDSSDGLPADAESAGGV